jgi:hypothetical protein
VARKFALSTELSVTHHKATKAESRGGPTKAKRGEKQQTNVPKQGRRWIPELISWTEGSIQN